MARVLKKKPTLTIEQKRVRLGMYIAGLRKQSHETLKSIEAKTGIPGANVFRIEQGQSMKFEDAITLANFFECSLGDLAVFLS